MKIEELIEKINIYFEDMKTGETLLEYNSKIDNYNTEETKLQLLTYGIELQEYIDDKNNLSSLNNLLLTNSAPFEAAVIKTQVNLNKLIKNCKKNISEYRELFEELNRIQKSVKGLN